MFLGGSRLLDKRDDAPFQVFAWLLVWGEAGIGQPDAQIGRAHV